MSTLLPIEYPFACGFCDAKSSVNVELGLCGRCKTIRYCVGRSCQHDHWQIHRKPCILAGSEAYYTDPSMAELPVDPRYLNLRDEPQISDDRCNEIIVRAIEAREQYEWTCSTAKEPEEMEREDDDEMVFPMLIPTDPRLPVALSWDHCRRKADNLCLESKDDVVELMRREVFHRLDLEKEMKALSIMHQSMMIKVIDLRKLAHNDPGLLARGLRDRINAFTRRSAELSTAIAYQTSVLTCNSVKIDWLVHSFLHHHQDAMPADADHCLLLTEDNEVEDEPIKKVVAILLALEVQGIDEGVFWEIKDRQDKQKILANARAFGELSQTQPWDRR